MTNSVTRYVYAGPLVVQERDGNNVPVVAYTRGPDLSGSLQGAGGIGGLLARTDQKQQPHTHAFYHADGSGNVTGLMDGNERLAARYSYDPFGNVLAMDGPLADANLYRFSSKEAHPVSGLVYYGYRFYDPNLQRWLNPDPVHELGGINLYAFVNNAALLLVDPFGLAYGHHPVPGEIYNTLPDGPAKDCFRKTSTGPLQGGHGWSKEHARYNNAVKDLWEKYLKQLGLDPSKPNDLSKLTKEHADEFLRRVRCSSNPAIRGFLDKIKGQMLRRVGGGLARKVPLVMIGGFVYDTANGGVMHAASNALWPISESDFGPSGYVYTPQSLVNAPPVMIIVGPPVLRPETPSP